MSLRMKVTTLGFESSYSVKFLEECPQMVRRFRRPSSKKVGLTFRDPSVSVCFEVETFEGSHWAGDFEGGPGGLTGAFGTPSPAVVCIVVEGQGFWIPVGNPSAYELVRSVPIKEVFAGGSSLLLFVDSTRLTGYGENGFLWQTEDVSWDGISGIEASSETILGLGWDSPAGRNVPFVVDPKTGKVRGGSSPERYT
jgi:hypothetical protein